MKLSKNRTENAFFLAAVAGFCGGSVPVFAKLALEAFHPFTLISIRFFFATLFLLPFVLKTRELNVTNLRRFFFVGFIGALNPIIFFIALQFTQASVSPLIYACAPALTAFYLFIAQNEKLTRRQISGILVGLIGVSLIVLLPLFEKKVDLIALKGNILIFVATIAFIAYGIVSKKTQKQMGATPIALTFYFSFVSLLVSLPLAGYEFLTTSSLAAIEVKHIVSGVYIGTIGTGLFYLTYQYALKLGSEVAASLFIYLQPIATISLAFLFLDEKITTAFIIGGVLAIFGAKLASSK